MKHLKHITLVLGILMLIPYTMDARRRGIPIGEREVINKVYDFPNTEDYQLEDGHYVDLATLHKEFNIAYLLPLYVTKEPILVGYEPESDSYIEIDESDMDEILAENNIKKADMLKLPFYTRYGGKGLALLIIAFFAYRYFGPRKEKEIIPKKL